MLGAKLWPFMQEHCVPFGWALQPFEEKKKWHSFVLCVLEHAGEYGGQRTASIMWVLGPQSFTTDIHHWAVSTGPVDFCVKILIIRKIKCDGEIWPHFKEGIFFLSITLRTTGSWPFGQDQAKVPCSYLDFSVRLLRSSECNLEVTFWVKEEMMTFLGVLRS